MEKYAHETLTLRSFFRQFPKGKVPSTYFKHLRAGAPIEQRDSLFSTRHPKEWATAQRESLQLELGQASRNYLDDRLNALNVKGRCILIGGPPCQAYSLAGRARNKGISGYRPEEDHRHFLYREYLRILAAMEPIAFVMENVKGILSAQIAKQGIFKQVLEDLQNPSAGKAKPRAPKYRLFPLSPRRGNAANTDDAEWVPSDFIVRAENHGVPQGRHRVIVVGIREDFVGGLKSLLLPAKKQVSAWQVIQDLPSVHPWNSRGNGTRDEWIECVNNEVTSHILNAVEPSVRNAMKAALNKLGHLSSQNGRGHRFLPITSTRKHYLGGTKSNQHLSRWIRSDDLAGFCNHESRAHMPTDFARYLFASSFAQVNGRTPKSPDYPRELWPKHKNFQKSVSSGHLFNDRFRVQVKGRPATTITSHMARDGHGFIHPDPRQCRSLTPREAARIQSFPDDYFFSGPRTAQYVQVGNAVPPYLAFQIAELLGDAIR